MAEVTAAEHGDLADDELDSGDSLRVVPLDESLAAVCSPGVMDHILHEHVLDLIAVPELLALLDGAGYGAARCFPGYDGVARTLREHGKLRELEAALSPEE